MRSWGAVVLAVAVPFGARADDEEVVVPAAKPASTEERLKKLEDEQAQLKKELERTKHEIPSFLRPFTLNAYFQGEYQNHQDSQDQIQEGGTLLNRDRFLVRRARAKVDADWTWAHLQGEIDANTVNGPILRPLHFFGTLQIPPLDKRKADVPIAAATIGLFDTPFGYELIEPPNKRWFMERSQVSRAFFASEPDLGVVLHGGISFARWSVAMMNGQPLDTKSGYPALSPAGAKDLVLKVGVETHPIERMELAADVSALRGKGFHAGTDATKNQILWRDTDENGAIEAIELVGAPATAATSSQTFDHWMMGADLRMRLKTRFGITALTTEVVVAQNMDRNLYIGDPILTSIDVRELGFQAGITQDITRWGIVGFRWDFYDPNSDILDTRVGRLVPSNQTINTFSPLVGLTWPEHARLIFQYDISRNHFARTATGVPTNLNANTLTIRLQVHL